MFPSGNVNVGEIVRSVNSVPAIELVRLIQGLLTPLGLKSQTVYPFGASLDRRRGFVQDMNSLFGSTGPSGLRPVLSPTPSDPRPVDDSHTANRSTLRVLVLGCGDPLCCGILRTNTETSGLMSGSNG